MASPTLPVRLANGAGNYPDAANWNDDYDWLTAYAFGVTAIANGGQEKWTAATTFTNPANGTTLTDNWTEVKSGTSACTADVSREATIIDSGLYSMKVNITGAGSSDSYWAIKQSANSPSAFGSLTLVAGAKVRAATANKARVKLYDGATSTYSNYHTGDSTFQLLQAKAAMAAGPSEVTITIEINPANFTGAVYIDSVYLYVVPSAISARTLAALLYSPLADVGQFLPLAGGTLTGVVLLPDGAVGAPALSFSADTDNGLYRIGANNPALAAGGAKVVDMKTSGVAILGTNTSDSAASGWVGEYLSSAQGTATNSPATGAFGDLVSITLTAGDWDVTGIVYWTVNGATWTGGEMGISSTSGNSVTGLTLGDTRVRLLISSTGSAISAFALTIPAVRFSVSGSTTVYLKYSGIFSAGTPQAQGRISARRVR